MSATEAAAREAFLAGLISLAVTGRVERSFPTPPEVLDYFRDKKLAPRFSWLDVWGEEHAHAFTVAGVLEDKVLAEFRAGIDQALKDGTGFDKFKADMEKRLKPLGWWGPRRVIDPDGTSMKTVDFTRPKRLRTTFWSNIRAARAAGQWDRIQRTKRALPFLLYVRTTAGDPRPEHLRWAGIILPVDHPFWRTHFPPNGWGCKCAVRQLSALQAERLLGREPEDGGIIYRDTPPEERMRAFINKRTGVRTQVPDGIDPGWHTNPGVGRSRTLGRILTDQLDSTPHELAAGRIARLVDSDGFRSWLVRAQMRGAERLALKKAGRTPAQINAAKPWQHASLPIAAVPPELARDLGTVRTTVTVTDAAVGHGIEHPLDANLWGGVAEIITSGEIWRRRTDGRIFTLHEIRGRLYLAWLEVGAGDQLELVTLYPHSRGRESGYMAKLKAGADRVR